MTQLDSKLERLLSQRSFSTLCELCDLGDRVFAFECARNSFTSALVYSRRTTDFFFAFLANSVLLFL